jgi:hypothetical protein
MLTRQDDFMVPEGFSIVQEYSPLSFWFMLLIVKIDI